MKHTKKMVLVPAQDGGGESENENMFAANGQEEVNEEEPSPKVSIRKYAADRQRKLLDVVLKLALYGGYDSAGRIKSKDGGFLESSDITPLLMHAFSPGRNIRGLPEFVDLLFRAGVEPKDIINSNVRELLRLRYRRGTPRPVIKRTTQSLQRNVPQDHEMVESPPQPVSDTIPVYTLDSEMSDISREKKRMREDLEEYSRAAKRGRWETTDSDEDD